MRKERDLLWGQDQDLRHERDRMPPDFPRDGRLPHFEDGPSPNGRGFPRRSRSRSPMRGEYENV